MSSRQRKRRGGAVDSGQARKQSRLLPSSAGGTSQAEQIDLEGSGTLSFEPAGEEVIDLTGKSSEPEVIVISDDESDVDREQSQEQPHASRTSENAAEPLSRNDEEETRDTDDDWGRVEYTPLSWLDEGSVDREQSQQQPHASTASENAAEPLARDDGEEPRDIDEYWWHLRRQPPSVRAEDNSAMPVMESNEEEQRDDNHAQPAGPASPLTSEDEDLELLQVPEQQRRDVTANSHEQADGSGSGTGANDAPVAGAAPAERGAEEEGSAHSDAQQGVVIRCPICMDVHSEVTERGRQLVATLCGHVFCSRCLPVVVDTTRTCPTCRVHLSPVLYHTIYL